MYCAQISMRNLEEREPGDFKSRWWQNWFHPYANPTDPCTILQPLNPLIDESASSNISALFSTFFSLVVRKMTLFTKFPACQINISLFEKKPPPLTYFYISDVYIQLWCIFNERWKSARQQRKIDSSHENYKHTSWFCPFLLWASSDQICLFLVGLPALFGQFCLPFADVGDYRADVLYLIANSKTRS